MFARVGNWEGIIVDIEDVASVGNQNGIIAHIENVGKSCGAPWGSGIAGDEQAM